MSENNKTSPLEAAARAAYNPTNRELMDELHRQNGISGAILAQAVKTNGRVTLLEKKQEDTEEDLQPIKAWCERFRVIAGASLIVFPFLFKVMEVAIDHIWPTR